VAPFILKVETDALPGLNAWGCSRAASSQTDNSLRQNPLAANQTRLPRSAPDVVTPLPEGIKNLTFDGFPFVRTDGAMRWQSPRNTKEIEP